MASRRAQAAIIVGGAVIVGGLVAILTYEELRSSPPTDQPPPISSQEVGFRFEDHRIVDHALGFSIDAPEPWARWQPPFDAGLLTSKLGVFLRHPDGVLINVNAGLRMPGTGIEPTLHGVLQDKLDQYGDAMEDVQWGREQLAGRFMARTVTLSLHQQGILVRGKIWAFATGSYWLNLMCSAPAPMFDEGERLCREVFDTFGAQSP